MRNPLIVRVKTEDLISIVRKNHEDHVRIFQNAYDKYRIMVIEQLEKNLAAAKDNKPFSQYVNLVIPRSHEGDYDCVLSMLKMHLAAGGDTIEISQEDYGCYVMDHWDWKEQFESTTSQYLAR